MDANLRQRIISGLIMAGLVVSLLLYNAASAQVLFIIIMLAMLYEFSAISLAGVSGAFSYVFWSIFGSLAMVLLLVYKYPDQQYMDIIIYLSVSYIVINILMLLTQKRTLLPIVPLIQSYLYITIPCVILLFWIRSHDSYGLTLLGVFIMIWGSDVFAYFAGRKFGKRKLFAAISPKKTWAGFIGAGIGTIVLALLCSYLLAHLPISRWLIIGLLIWLFGSLGDLVESSFKRHFRIKDSGTILSGHGGFLDRLDSFIFAIPVVILYLNYASHAS